MIRTTINMEGRREGRLHPFCYWQHKPESIRPVDLDPNRLNWMHEYPRDAAIYLPRHRKRRLMDVVYTREWMNFDWQRLRLWATPRKDFDCPDFSGVIEERFVKWEAFFLSGGDLEIIDRMVRDALAAEAA